MIILKNQKSNRINRPPVYSDDISGQDAPLLQMLELVEVIGQIIDYDEILRVVSRKAMDIFSAEYVSLIIINPRTQHTLKTVIKRSLHNKAPLDALLQTNIIGWTSKNRMPFLSQNIHQDTRFSADLRKNQKNFSVICAPVERQNCIIGYIILLKPDHPDPFTEDSLIWAQKLSLLFAPYLCDLKFFQKYFEPPMPQTAMLRKYETYGLIGKSAKFIDMLKSVEAAARCDVRVLLEGDSGTGKELVAHAIHHLSARSGQPFVAIDCGAIPEHLIESELFGHVRGSFTGAASDRVGLFEEANHGTMFIDEISNLPLPMQVKLLRVMQEGEIRPLGSNKSRRIDVRIISASSPSLQEMVNQKLFRQDLYFRLHVYPIIIPSLCERISDIPILADYFVRKFAAEQGKKAELLHPTIARHLQQRPWPGNIRELENFIERLVTLVPEDIKMIDFTLLPPEIHELLSNGIQDIVEFPNPHALQKRVEQFEREIISETLNKTGWNQSETARVLDLSERTIRYKMQKLGIRRRTLS